MADDMPARLRKIGLITTEEAADEIELLRGLLGKAYTERERAESVLDAVGVIVEHDCDEVIHPKCWANILAAYHTYKERGGDGA